MTVKKNEKVGSLIKQSENMSVLWVSNLSQWIGKHVHVLIEQSSNYSLNWKLEDVDDQRRNELEILMREFNDVNTIR